jgi:hypothetical protein
MAFSLHCELSGSEPAVPSILENGREDELKHQHNSALTPHNHHTCGAWCGQNAGGGWRVLLGRRRRRKDLALASGFRFRLRLGSLLGFFLASVFVSHGCKNATKTRHLKSRKLAHVRVADANLLTRRTHCGAGPRTTCTRLSVRICLAKAFFTSSAVSARYFCAARTGSSRGSPISARPSSALATASSLPVLS